MKPTFTVEHWPHGQLVCAPPGEAGIQLRAVSDYLNKLPPGFCLSNGIVHHYRQSGRQYGATVALGTAEGISKWKEDITTWLLDRKPETQWWWGTDVGRSSAVIFSVLGPPCLAAYYYGNGAVPVDAEDFGRCLRLLALFPVWRERLHEVAQAWPLTPWPRITTRWDELAALEAEKQTALLDELNRPEAR